MAERKHTWTVRLIFHAGDGPPGEPFKTKHASTVEASDAAEEAARLADEKELYGSGGADCDGDFDNTTTVIEVETQKGWKRFYVRCRVVRQYTATLTTEGLADAE